MSVSAFRFGKVKSNIVPSGTKDGVNNTFSITPDYYQPDSLRVFLNGFMYQPVSIQTNTNKQTFDILADNLPLSSDSLTVAYVDDENCGAPDPFANLKTFNSNLQSYWALEAASGTRVDTQLNNNFTAVGTAGNTTGKKNNAYDCLATTTDQLRTYITEGSKFTWACWFKFDSSPTFAGIISGDANVPFSPPVWQVIWASNQISFVATSQSLIPVIGQWYHVVVTKDSTTNTVQLFLNGNKSSTSGSASATSRQFVNGSIFFNSIWNTFDGAVDEVAYWDDVLSDTAIAELYNSGSGAFWDGSNWA